MKLEKCNCFEISIQHCNGLTMIKFFYWSVKFDGNFFFRYPSKHRICNKVNWFKIDTK